MSSEDDFDFEISPDLIKMLDEQESQYMHQSQATEGNEPFSNRDMSSPNSTLQSKQSSPNKHLEKMQEENRTKEGEIRILREKLAQLEQEKFEVARKQLDQKRLSDLAQSTLLHQKQREIEKLATELEFTKNDHRNLLIHSTQRPPSIPTPETNGTQDGFLSSFADLTTLSATNKRKRVAKSPNFSALPQATKAQSALAVDTEATFLWALSNTSLMCTDRWEYEYCISVPESERLAGNIEMRIKRLKVEHNDKSQMAFIAWCLEDVGDKASSLEYLLVFTAYFVHNLGCEVESRDAQSLIAFLGKLPERILWREAYDQIRNLFTFETIFQIAQALLARAPRPASTAFGSAFTGRDLLSIIEAFPEASLELLKSIRLLEGGFVSELMMQQHPLPNSTSSSLINSINKYIQTHNLYSDEIFQVINSFETLPASLLYEPLTLQLMIPLETDAYKRALEKVFVTEGSPIEDFLKAHIYVLAARKTVGWESLRKVALDYIKGLLVGEDAEALPLS